MGALVAERKLDHDGHADVGYARVFAPEPDKDDWRCAYEIEWPGFNRSFRVIGVDSWQALQLAMQIVPVEISTTADFKSGRLGAFGAALQTNADLIEWLAPTSMKVLEQ